MSSIGEGSDSVEASVAPCSVSLAPTNIVATPGSGQVALNWNASAGATSYSVSRFTSDMPPVVIATVIVATIYTDTNAVDGQLYYFPVAAANACNQTAPSVFVAGQATAVAVVLHATGFWTNTITTSAQNWNVNANWTNTSVFPNGAGSNVVIQRRTLLLLKVINLNVPVTVGSLSIGDPNGSGFLPSMAMAVRWSLNNGTSAAAMTQVATSAGDTIAAPVTVAGNTDGDQ